MTKTTASLNLRPAAGTNNTPILVIPNGSEVTVTGDPWYPVTYNGQAGWVSGKYLTDLPAEPTPPSNDFVSDAMALAKRMKGLYYKWGGNFTQEPFSAKRGDCSGYVGFVLDTIGYQPGSNKLYNYSADQQFDNFRNGIWPAQKITVGQEEEGDIVYYGDGTYASHVVLVTARGRIIGSNHGNATVTSDAAAKARGAMVTEEDIHFHSKSIVGIYRPIYP